MSNKNWGRGNGNGGKISLNGKRSVATLGIPAPRVLEENELQQIVSKMCAGRASLTNAFELFGYAITMSFVSELLAQRLAFYERDAERFDTYRKEVEAQALAEAHRVYSRIFDNPEEKQHKGH